MLRRLLIAGTLALAASSASAQMLTLGFGQGAFTTSPVMMVTPLMFVSNTANNPSTTVINYVPLTGSTGSNNILSSPAGKPDVFPVAGTISNLQVYLQTDPSPGSYDVGLIISSTKQTLVCNVGAGAHSCSDSAHNISISVADLVGFFICPSNGSTCTAGSVPTAQTTPFQVSVTFTSTVGQESLITGGGLGTNASATVINYTGFGGHSVWNATENLVSNVMPTAGTIDKLYAFSGTAGASASNNYTVVKNGVDTSLTCSISGGSATTCNDTTGGHAFTVVQGDTISLKSCPSNTATCPAGSAPSARGVAASVRWVPTTSGQAVILDTPSTLPGTNTTATFMPAAGAANPQTTELNQVNIVPGIPGGMTFSINNLTVAQCPGPGAAATRVDTLRLGTAGGTPASQSLAATVGIGTTACPTFSTATASGAVTATAGQVFDWQTQNSATNTALTTLKIGATVNIQ